MLSCSFGCDQIHSCHKYDFGHTLFVLLTSNLDVQQTHLWPLRPPKLLRHMLLNFVPCQPSLMFEDKDRSGAPERCFTWVGSGLT
jgi:hypothetical protein